MRRLFGAVNKKLLSVGQEFFWRSGRDSNPRAAFDDNTISSRARYDLFDTTAYIQFPLTDSVDYYTKISTDVKTFFCSSATIIHNVITRRRANNKHRKSFKMCFSRPNARERLTLKM